MSNLVTSVGCFAMAWLALVGQVCADDFKPLVTVSGPATFAKLASLDAAGQFSLVERKGEASENRQLALDQLVSWGVPSEVVDGPLVLLVDGSMIAQPQRGRTVAISNDQLQLSQSSLGPLAIPLEFVRAVLFRPPSDAAARDRRVAELLSIDDLNTDELLVENGDRVAGSIVSLGKEHCELKTTAGAAAKIETARIAGLRFNPTLLARPPVAERRVVVGLADGTRVTATQFKLQNNQLTLRPLVGGATREAEWSTPVASLAFVQPLSGKAIYLSDLPVEGYRHVPYLTVEWPYQLDRNVLGMPLRSGNRQYLKGVGMHSAARLTFKLDKPYRRFEAAVGIDDSTGGRGHVVCRVFVNAEARFTSGPIRGGQPVTSVSVDTSGGTLLSLIVDFGDGGDTLDRVNWLDARLVE